MKPTGPYRSWPRTSTGKGRKISITFPDSMSLEIEQEAQRQGRSVSELVRKAWGLARKRLQQIQSHLVEA